MATQKSQIEQLKERAANDKLASDLLLFKKTKVPIAKRKIVVTKLGTA